MPGTPMDRDPARRSALAAFAGRVAVLGTFAVSAAITLVEDPKEVRKLELRDRRAREPPPPTLVFDEATVLDRESKLEWQREAAPERLDWERARAYCAELALDGGGFRLPSRDELMTVLKHTDDPFGGALDWYWSSTIGVRAGTAWAVGSGAWLNGNPVETKSRVRCVRDAPSEVRP